MTLALRPVLSLNAGSSGYCTFCCQWSAYSAAHSPLLSFALSLLPRRAHMEVLARYVRLFCLLIVGRSRRGTSSLASATQRQLASMRASMHPSVEQLALARMGFRSGKNVELRRVAPLLVRKQTSVPSLSLCLVSKTGVPFRSAFCSSSKTDLRALRFVFPSP